MSASLLVLIPPTLLAIVLLLCFVGCTNEYRDFDVAPSVADYSTDTILPNPGLVAYWPLGEADGATKAVDLKGGHDGDYLSQYFPAEAQGAEADGTRILGSPGIVPGDTVAPHDADSPKSTCMLTDGGYVSVDFAAFNPTKGFTLEAWVSAGWDAEATPAYRTVIASLESVGGFKGFVLLATPDNQWAALIGNGGAGATGLTQATGEGTLMVETTYHLVATYDNDSSDLTLYVNGAPNLPTPADYHPAAANPLYIGASRPDLPEPHYPFNGKIQCVAVYDMALDAATVLQHYQAGIGP
jgi:hypothetical protein